MSRRALAAGGCGHRAEASAPTRSIPFGTTDVRILSGRSPVLVVSNGGLILTAINVTVHDSVTNTNLVQGNTINSGDTEIFVNDIHNPGIGHVLFRAESISGGNGAPADSSEGLWTFVQSLSKVLIVNNWTKNIKINNIDVLTTDKPTVTLTKVSDTSDSPDGNPGVSVTLTFRIDTAVLPSLIDIENTTNADIVLNGTINNPVGVTEINNSGGDVLSTHDRFTTDGTYATGTQVAPCGQADTTATNAETNGRYAIVCTNVVAIHTPSGDIGSNSVRVNLGIVDSTGNPAATQFTTGRVSSLLDSIYLGPHSFFTGEQVRYADVSGATSIGGLSNNTVYWVIALPDGFSIQLAASYQDALDGVAIPLTPNSTLSTQKHSLTPIGRFSADAAGDVWLDIRAENRTGSSTYVVKVDGIIAGGNIDLMLRPSVSQSAGSGTSAGILVNGGTGNDGTYYTFFHTSPDTAPGVSTAAPSAPATRRWRARTTSARSTPRASRRCPR